MIKSMSRPMSWDLTNLPTMSWVKEDGDPQDSEVGFREDHGSIPNNQSPGESLGFTNPPLPSHANGGNMSRAPYATENMRMEVCLLGMQGLGKPGRHMFTTIEWGLFGDNESAEMDFRQDHPGAAACGLSGSGAGQPRLCRSR